MSKKILGGSDAPYVGYNPTERDQQIAREAAEACSAHAYAKYRISGVDTCDEFYREILAAIQDANQQGNEDMVRALKRFGQHAVNCGDNGKCTCGLDAAIDAARGVQPAAKDPFKEAAEYKRVDDIVWRAVQRLDHRNFRIGGLSNDEEHERIDRDRKNVEIIKVVLQEVAAQQETGREKGPHHEPKTEGKN